MKLKSLWNKAAEDFFQQRIVQQSDKRFSVQLKRIFIYEIYQKNLKSQFFAIERNKVVKIRIY